MFDKFIGNEQIKIILKRMLAKNRVPHSFLFAGEEGIGKKQFALELAKAFVCQNPQNSEACDKCHACKRVDKFTFPKSDDRDDHKKVIFSEFPDIGQVIAYNKNILVDAIRDLEKEANYRPYEAQARFFIIDEADKMNDAASNALLKTLEEPAPTTYLFLITSRPDALLQTIHSRCQTLRFAPVSAAEIEKHLLETKKFAPDDAELLSLLSNGSIGHALTLDLAKFREQRDAMLKVLQSLLIEKNRAFLLKTAEELADAKNKDSYESSLDILQTLIHDIWKIKLDADEFSIVNRDYKTQIKLLAEKADAKRLAKWLTEIEQMRQLFAVNLNKKLATDALFMQMASAH
ncbi:MAG TPA: DNA polymerase III subunit delta' [Pyrinomonadaceae bacterium]|nr:DNA polymerase III subunit delta' [Pyrinomonadaceae bacterium]